MTMTQRDTDALPSVRACVTALPEQLLSPPYEMRSEMNWIDFSGTANPLGTPPHILFLPLLAQWPRSFLADANVR